MSAPPLIGLLDGLLRDLATVAAGPPLVLPVGQPGAASGGRGRCVSVSSSSSPLGGREVMCRRPP